MLRGHGFKSCSRVSHVALILLFYTNPNSYAALEAATSTSETHLSQIDTLEQELFELKGEIAGGRHVPPGVRVLSMAQNPEQEWFDARKEVMERLKGENEALMKRLRELEEAGVKTQQNQGGSDEGSTEGMVPRQSWELVCQEKEELETEVKQKEKRLKRLKEVCIKFSSTTSYRTSLTINDRSSIQKAQSSEMPSHPSLVSSSPSSRMEMCE
jgi:hypothetical protein